MAALFKVSLVDEDGGPVEAVTVVANDGERAVKAARMHARSEGWKGRLVLSQVLRLHEVDVVD